MNKFVSTDLGILADVIRIAGIPDFEIWQGLVEEFCQSRKVNGGWRVLRVLFNMFGAN
jgi:hypothetical protein